MKNKYKIQNIVVTASLGKPVQLTKLVKTNPNAEYDPKQFPALVLRIKKLKSSVLIFPSGDLVCTGMKTFKEIGEVIKEVVNQIKKTK